MEFGRNSTQIISDSDQPADHFKNGRNKTVSEFIPTIFTPSRDVQEMESHC
jgi:hypothetical protein